MDDQAETNTTRTWRDIAYSWLLLALIPTALATVIGFAASLNDIAELFVHFKVVYWWLALISLIGLLILRSWAWAALALIVVLIHSVGIVPWYISPATQPPPNAQPNLTLLNANVLSTNKTPEEVIEYIRATDPDIMLLQEISPKWIPLLQPLIDTDYPHALIEEQTDNFGMATLSKLPLDALAVIDPLGWSIPVIEVKLTLNGRKVSVLNYHPLPPGSGDYVKLRNEQLAYISTYIREQSDLAIVAGDLNVTPWSPHYTSMIEESGLYNTRKGFGLLLTWPAPPMIPIDHILASPTIHTLNMEIGPDNGSDHRPLLVELYIPKK